LPAIDSHAHVFSARAPAVRGARYRPAYAATLAAWRSAWAGAGITHGVVVQPSFFGTDNREMRAAVASDLDHLRGVAVVEAGADTETLAALHADGVRAIRLNLKGVDDYSTYAMPPWAGLFERVHASGWHVEIHVDTGRLAEIAEAFADVAVALVFDHFGSPGDRTRDATFAAVARLAKSRDVWGKLSGPYRLEGGEPRELAARWLDTVGPDRVVWGSDWPWTSHEGGQDYARLRGALDEWVDARVARAALWDNAARLYRFD
jgi:predicted TIM-barrel fold metal-dependent hydrolase